MFLRMVLVGLLTAAVFGGANGALSLYSPWSATSFVLWYVIPAGAVILGFLGALGVGVGTDLHGDRRAEALNLLVWGPVLGAATIAINYFVPYQVTIYPALLHHPQLSYFAFLNEYFSHFSLDGDSEMGGWGIAMGWSDFAGAAVGGLFGAFAAAAWTRQSAGVKAIPKWVESAAAIMANVAHADGVVKPEETTAAMHALERYCAEYYEAKEGNVGDLEAFARDLTLNTLEEAKGATLEPHFRRLARAPIGIRRLTLFGAIAVAAADGDMAPEELTALRGISDRLGLPEAEFHDTIVAVQAQLMTRRAA